MALIEWALLFYIHRVKTRCYNVVRRYATLLALDTVKFAFFFNKILRVILALLISSSFLSLAKAAFYN
jgi:hypothetical protein